MLTYRPATPKDAIGIATVLKESYNIKTIEEGIEVFKNETAKQYHFIVADDGGRIAGITTWQMHGLPKHGLCELDRIAVLPDYKGKGVAKGLFKALIKDSNIENKKYGFKLRKLYILCHADNKRAHAFYKKVGMKYETTLKDHYYKGKDELVFSRFF
ncbi:GNAT family N-acetyltransferase [Candidatus Woesearchaeota archaeon]|nr:GNAT family N-acetyltransferase [Candidatus Woesearchaeota archaeon]